MSNTSEMVNQKQAASMLGISVWSFRQNERNLGLYAVRRCWNSRVILYPREAVCRLLESARPANPPQVTTSQRKSKKVAL